MATVHNIPKPYWNKKNLSCNLAVNSVRSLFNLLEIWGKHDLRAQGDTTSFLVSFCSKSNNKTIIRFPASIGSIYWSLHEIANMTGPMAGQWLKPNQSFSGFGFWHWFRAWCTLWRRDLAGFVLDVFGCQVEIVWLFSHSQQLQYQR